MSEMELQNKINGALWNICEYLKMNLPTNYYQDYILTMLCIKFISDIYKDKKEGLTQKYNRR